MTLVYVLLAGHFVADFVCQSDWMALNKSKRWDALAWHVLAYTGALYVALAATAWLGLWSNPYASFDDHWFYVVNAAAHFIQDALTSRLTSRLWFFKMNPGIWAPAPNTAPQRSLRLINPWTAEGGNRHWFFVAIGFDQLLHYVTLLVTAGWWLR